MRTSIALVAVAVVLSGCGVGGRRVDENIPPRSDDIVIGAFNFSESQVLAEVYHRALEEAGFNAQVLANVGPREIMAPALEQDQIDIAIEYLGAALAFFDPETSSARHSLRAAYDLLDRELGLRGIEPLETAPGENRNEIVVTGATAREHDLRSISDLQKVDSEMTFGGPAECTARPLCLRGLKRLYQLEFESFLPLDAGGPLTVASLESGEVDVALLFTTNPALGAARLVVLEDDRNLQPPENLLPVVRDAVVREGGAELTATLNSVTRLLTNDELRRLNEDVDIQNESPQDAASRWLAEKGLV